MLLSQSGDSNINALNTGANKKGSRSRKTLISYYVMFVIVNICKLTVLYPRLSKTLTIIALVVDGFSLLLHILMTLRDPGYIKNDGIEFMKLLETFEATSLCPDCEIIKKGRSRHCVTCNRCVDRFDHHCPWINNCIGIYNHNMFLCYLMMQ